MDEQEQHTKDHEFDVWTGCNVGRYRLDDLVRPFRSIYADAQGITVGPIITGSYRNLRVRLQLMAEVQSGLNTLTLGSV